MSFKRNLTVYALAAWFPFQALAQEVSPFNAILGNQWLSTVEAVPEVLRNRLAGEEVLYSGDLVTEEVAKKILDADKTTVTKKISSLVDPKIYSSLQRQMKSSRLVDLIKEGRLVPNTYQVGSNSEETSMMGVYLELHLVKSPKPFEWGDVELHFDPTLLDRSDYLINPHWDFGLYGPLTATPLLNLGRVAFYVENYLQEGRSNEVVFLNEISFAAVKQIVVPTGKRAELLKKIANAKLNCPQSDGCEKLIIERDLPKKK